MTNKVKAAPLRTFLPYLPICGARKRASSRYIKKWIALSICGIAGAEVGEKLAWVRAKQKTQ